MSGLDPILRPQSIAVIGASREYNTVGHQILANLVTHGFNGPVYPVNPRAAAIHSLRAYPEIGAVPDPVDLAIVAVPKQHVAEVAEACGRKGVRGLVVISAGFREVGGEGVGRETQLVEIVRRYGMRMVGPNCLGVLNADPAISMNATFAPVMPPFGRVAFMAQSGALGLSLLDYAKEYGIGIAQFVSVGNKPDVSGNDLLAYWEHDAGVDVILMYVENFGNPRRFLEIASRLTKRKPILVVKSGRSRAGARAASSHTGSLAASDTAVEALLAQAGVLRAASVEELFDLAAAFSGGPSPQGRRTAVVTNSGGPGILAADALDANGLELPELDPGTIARLQPHFPGEASLRNPLDMIATATSASYHTALDLVLADPGVDSAVAIFVPPIGIKQSDVAEAIAQAAIAHHDKPVLAVLMGREGLPQGRSELHDAQVPAYVFPESAARALAGRCRYAEWQRRPEAEPEILAVDTAAASRLLEAARAAGLRKLPEPDTLELFAAYGIPVARSMLAKDPDAAVRLAEQMGYPVVAKVVAPEVIHKTDVGGVRTGLTDGPALRRAWEAIHADVSRAVPQARIAGILIQKMAAGGRELIVGMTRDPSFGPMVMFGLGGIWVEALRDTVFRIAPISRLDAGDMLRGIRAFSVLGPLRGTPPVDLRALEDVLLRISRLAVDFPVIEELDINPLLARGDGILALDGRVILAGGRS